MPASIADHNYNFRVISITCDVRGVPFGGAGEEETLARTKKQGDHGSLEDGRRWGAGVVQVTAKSRNEKEKEKGTRCGERQ